LAGKKWRMAEEQRVIGQPAMKRRADDRRLGCQNYCTCQRRPRQQQIFLLHGWGTIRLRLLKIGALVRTSVRRIKLGMPSAFPYQSEYHTALTAAARVA
jgi:hypothetical protein